MTLVLAVDGNSLAHRAFHAFGPRDGMEGATDANGRPVWAVEGFLGFLAGLVERVRPDRLVVGFDDATASSRRERYSAYKDGRSEKSPDLVEQLARLVVVLKELGVTVVVPDGLEADDVMAGARAWAHANKASCVIATSDRDSFALIDTTTRVLRLANGGLSQAELLDEAALLAKYSVPASRYGLFAALRGDSSDNLPGVSGVGEKTAAKVCEVVGSVSELLDDLGNGTRLKSALSAGVVKKLSDEVSQENLRRNDDLMEMLPVEVVVGGAMSTCDDVAGALRRLGLRDSVRLVRALAGATPAVPVRAVAADALGLTGLEPELVIDHRIDPSDTFLSGRLRAAVGVSASMPAPAAPTTRTYGPVPAATLIPNPRPERSLLS